MRQHSSRLRRPCFVPARSRFTGLLALATLAAPLPWLHAQTVSTWNGGTGTWSSTNWSNGVPNSTGLDVFLDGGKTGTASVVNVDGSYSVGRLTVDAGDTVTINSAASAGVGGERGLFFSPGAFAGAGTLVNNGLITLNATGAYTGVSNQLVNLRADGTSLSLTGTGTVQMTDSTNNRILGDSLSFGAGQTVRGGGQIFATTVTNAGLLDGTGATYGIVLSPTNLTNTGTLRASSGGLLTLNGGTTNNAGGTISALAGSVVVLTNQAVVTGGTLSTTGTGVIRAQSVTLDGVTNMGTVAINAGASALLTNTVTNNGTFTFNATGAYAGSQAQVADLRYNGNVTIAGTGTILLTDSSNNRLFSDQASRLTLGAGQTLQGAGRLLETGSGLTNQGLINATGTSFALSLTVAGSDRVANTGTVQASNGGTLQLGGEGTNNGTFNNAGGVVQALTGSTVRLESGVNVTGGTLATAGTGVITVGAATVTNLTNNGTVVVAGAGQPTLSTAGTITNNGRINVTSTGGISDLYLTADTTLAGMGTVTLTGPGSSNNARIFGNTGTRLTVGAGQTIQGTGELGLGYIAVTNGGLIQANNAGGSFIIYPANVANAFLNTGNGVVRATGGGVVTFNTPNGSVVTNNGVFAASGNGSVLTVPAASLSNYSNGTLTGGTYTASGTSASTPATVNLTGATVTTNAATIKLIGAGASIPAINALTTNQGVFALDGNRTFTTAGNLSNNANGTVAVAAGSTLAVSGAFNQTGGSLVGAGTIRATGTQTLGGTVAPGALVLGENAVGFSEFNPSIHAAGSLTLQGTSVAFAGSTSLLLSLGAPAGAGGVGANNDHVFVTGNFILDGTLNVTARTGFGPGTYDLLDYSGGTFTNNVLDLGTLPAGYSYRLDTTIPGQVDLIVSVVPEPSTWVLLGLGIVGVGMMARRQRRASTGR